jgi:hypothetical protein
MAELYRQKVTTLAQDLEHPETRTEATEALQGLIDAIVLTPAEDGLKNRTEGESRGDAEYRHKCEEVARNRRPLAASSNSWGALNQRYLRLWSGAA